MKINARKYSLIATVTGIYLKCGFHWSLWGRSTMAMASQLRMLYMGINENMHTRTSFVSVTAAFCEWVTGKYSFF